MHAGGKSLGNIEVLCTTYHVPQMAKCVIRPCLCGLKPLVVFHFMGMGFSSLWTCTRRDPYPKRFFYF
jgi:hypothetical protein